MIQYLLLGIFAASALVSFMCRLRVGMLEGAVSRGVKQEGEVQLSVERFRQMAVRTAIIAAVSLALCVVAGAIDMYT